MFMKNNFYFDLFFTLSGISYFPFLLGTGFSKAYFVCGWRYLVYSYWVGCC